MTDTQLQYQVISITPEFYNGKTREKKNIKRKQKYFACQISEDYKATVGEVEGTDPEPHCGGTAKCLNRLRR